MTEQNQLELWDDLKVDSSITTENLDQMISVMAELKGNYEELKKQSDEAFKLYEKARGQVIAALSASNKSKYFVDGIGTVSLVEKLKVRTPQSIEEKGEFYKWLNQKFGADGFLSYTGINYQTLNSLYNQEFDKAREEGKADSFNIPGVQQPDTEISLSFRQKK